MTLMTFLAQEIGRRGPLTFADYMDIVLYHPEWGYYSQTASPISRDFLTSPSLSPLFGQFLAHYLIQCWQTLGQPTPFTLLEGGAGTGSLALQILTTLAEQAPACYGQLTYGIVERSPARRQQQAQLLQGHPVRWGSWQDFQGMVGCVLSNELLDALPVHRVIWQGGQWQELCVTYPLADLICPLSTPRIADYFQLCGLGSQTWPEGYTTEVHLSLLDWVSTVDQILERGYVITIDYGHPASRYYHPRRHQGTLLCYRQHQTNADPYSYVGKQDITAHVNWTALENQGSRLGWQTLERVSQAEFLARLGMIEDLAQRITKTDLQTALNLRQQMHALLDPMGLGGFEVCLQGKNLQ
ncbi:MAG: SAM-dependent methyltransferase [Thermostichales cyanobacterium SZTDM-1c_bins_54]